MDLLMAVDALMTYDDDETISVE